MNDTAITAVGLADAATGLNYWAMFLNADLMIKGVMLLLVVASVWCWAVIFDKTVRIGRLRRQANAFERTFWSGAALDELYHKLAQRVSHPMAMMFASAMEEWREAPRTHDAAFNRGLVGRIVQVMTLTMDREIENLERNLSWLATIAAAGPLLGLLGTVWGIMNSFQAIAATKNATLSVVAPGISEALFTTALGLIAAIPAAIAYNRLSGAVDGYANRLASFADEFAVVLSRELDSAKMAA
ncbi:MAG: protein TolQ [Geminicoccaceae bacterium]